MQTHLHALCPVPAGTSSRPYWTAALPQLRGEEGPHVLRTADSIALPRGLCHPCQGPMAARSAALLCLAFEVQGHELNQGQPGDEATSPKWHFLSGSQGTCFLLVLVSTAEKTTATTSAPPSSTLTISGPASGSLGLISDHFTGKETTRHICGESSCQVALAPSWKCLSKATRRSQLLLGPVAVPGKPPSELPAPRE